MSSSRWSKTMLTAACLAATLCVAPSPATAGPWTFSGTAGFATSYRLYRWSFLNREYWEAFPGTWTAGVSATNSRRNWLALRIAGRWARYVRFPTMYHFPEDVAPIERWSVDIITMGVGARFQYASPGSPKAPVFFDIAPVLSVYGWERKFTQIGNDTWGQYVHRVEDETLTRLKPGLEVGAGVELRPTRHLRPEVGIRYLVTATPGRVPFVDSRPGPVRGLTQFAMYVSLGWTP